MQNCKVINMQKNTSKVYVKVDKQNRILCCEGGYTTPNDLTDWVLIDEGSGDKYNLCQSHYFDKPIYTEHGIPQYKLLDGKAVERTSEEISAERLEPLKENRIVQSKTELQIYLAEHPLQWTDGKYYTITAEKQQQLTSKLLSATFAQQAQQPYNLTWNDTEQICEPWTLENLTALAFAIDARVTALVTYQQEKERLIRDAETLETLESIVVNYDEVV